jgi:phosphomannomutase
MPKHVFFDLDKTLTASRSPMTPEHQEIFDKLLKKSDVIVVSGGNEEQIRRQTTPGFVGRYYALAQSGNHAMDKSGATLWEESLTGEQETLIEQVIRVLEKEFPPALHPATTIEHRGAQTSYSVTGFDAPIEAKYAFDPGDIKRNSALRAHPDEVAKLTANGIEVTPAGTSSFNFILAGKHKGFNITRFIKKMGWKSEDCIYVGDALFPGGNDETVIGVIPTHAIKDHEETFRFIKESLLS